MGNGKAMAKEARAGEASCPRAPRPDAAARPSADAAPRGGRPARDDRLWTPVFLFVIGVTLCTFLVGQGLNAGTSVYITALGGTATYAGLLATVFSVAAAGARFICGPLVDDRGRRVAMVAGSVVMMAGTAGPIVTGDSELMILWRFLQGIGFSAATTASATAAADVLPRERLGEGIGYFGLGQALAMSIGPALSLFLVSTDPPENLFVGVTLAGALALAFSLLCRYEKDPEKLPVTSAYRVRWERARLRPGQGEEALERAEEHADAGAEGAQGAEGARRAEDAAGDAKGARGAERAQRAEGAAGAASGSRGARAGAERPRETLVSRVIEPKALHGALPALCIVPAVGFVIFFVGLYGTVLGVGNAGLFYTVSAVSMVAVRLKSGAFMDRVPAIKVLTAAVACGIVGFVVLLAAGALEGGAREAAFYAAGLPYGLCLGVCQPLNQSIAVKCSPPERWGAANAVFQLAIDVGMGASTVVWGMLNDTLGFSASLVGAIICLLIGYAMAWLAYPPEEKLWHRRR
ncbi:MFS transporter [Adlercreutzia faecimuris]|uniref:MFS transporter n=1 Tax=Adlercreutzia faecimuris TaxID=2897341 RepID=A0ABS9WET4_9ACTN|nr:MFS transporter [Adlercreutzia sp. JBNU-10]MCI2241295.1 MFS transporter [Adlercreutzia sp. JBNU-10]